jgi:iron complex transport system permease protein
MDARKSLIAIGFIVATTLLIIVLGLLPGAKTLSFENVLRVLWAPDGKIESILVWTLRLPRSLAAAVAGAGLAVSGYLLQALTRNPLADPGITGVTAGAIAPIVTCFVFLPWLSSVYYPFVGLAGGLAAASVTFWVARGGNGRPLHLALGGVSVSLFLGAITIYVLLLAGPQSTALLFWLSGGFQGRTWSHLAHMLPWVALGVAGALLLHRVIAVCAQRPCCSRHGASAQRLEAGAAHSRDLSRGRCRSRRRSRGLCRSCGSAYRSASEPQRSGLGNRSHSGHRSAYCNLC